MPTVNYFFTSVGGGQVNNNNNAGDEARPAIAAGGGAGGRALFALDDGGDLYGFMSDGEANSVAESATGVSLNTTTSSAQTDATLARLASGQFVMAFTDTSAGASAAVIRLRVFDQSMNPVTVSGSTNDFVVAGLSSGDQIDAQLAALNDGGFVVTWTDVDGNNANDVQFTIYNSDFTVRLSGQFARVMNDLNTERTEDPHVAALTGGGFVIVWAETNSGETEIRFQRYDANGTAQGSATLVDDVGAVNDQPEVVGLANGGFAIAYRDDGWTGLNNDITIATYDATGSVDAYYWANQFSNGGAQGNPTIARISDDFLAVAWDEDTAAAAADRDIRMGVFRASDGSAVVSPVISVTTADQFAIASLGNGRIASAWREPTDPGSGGAGTDVFGDISDLWRETIGDGTDETINGDDIRDQIIGLSGNDTINGMGGNDRIIAGSGADTVNGGDGDDVIEAHHGQLTNFETFNGDAGFDTVLLLKLDPGQIDLVFYTYGFSSIERLVLADSGVDGGVSISLLGSQISGFSSALNVVGNNLVNEDIIIELGSTPGAVLNLGSWTFNGWNPASDLITINAAAGAERVTGSPVSDVISGLGGNDTLIGGLGVDELYGDAGNDLIYFDPADAAALGGADFDALFALAGQNPFAFDLVANGFEQGILFYNDGPGGAAFLNSFVYYQPGWIVEYQDTNYDDGSRQVLYRDWQSIFAYSQYTDYYDSSGQLQARQTVFDDTHIENQFFDLPPNDPFASYIDFYNVAGQLAARQTINDDNSYQSTFFDLAANPWSYYTDFHNAAGQLIARQTINDDNSYSNTFFDPVPPNANAFAQYTDFYNPAGVFIGRTGINDDGSTF